MKCVNKGLVSVIIPMYNAEDTIITTLESVIAQSYKKYEIIIVNDGSTDDGKQIVRDWMSNQSLENVIEIVDQVNAGPSKARNYGIDLSSGEYIAFLDADDSWLPNKLQRQVELMVLDSELGLVGTLAKNLNDRKERNSPYMYISFKQLLFSNLYCTSSVMIRRRILYSNLFDEKQKYSEDYKLWLQINYMYKCILINEVLTVYRNDDLSRRLGLSSKLWNMECAELANYKEVYDTRKIDLGTYVCVSIYSIMKYVLRCVRKYACF